MTKRNQPVTRRDILTGAAAGVLTAAMRPIGLRAAEPTDVEKANLTLVDDFCAAWVAPMSATRISEFLAENCVYRATESAPPRTGRNAIVEFLQEFAGEASSIEFEVVERFARGPIVVNERWDRFALPTRSFEWHGVGVFYIVNGEIAEWSDFTIT